MCIHCIKTLNMSELHNYMYIIMCMCIYTCTCVFFRKGRNLTISVAKGTSLLKWYVDQSHTHTCSHSHTHTYSHSRTHTAHTVTHTLLTPTHLHTCTLTPSLSPQLEVGEDGVVTVKLLQTLPDREPVDLTEKIYSAGWPAGACVGMYAYCVTVIG